MRYRVAIATLWAILAIVLYATGLQDAGRLTVCIWVAFAWVLAMAFLAAWSDVRKLERRIKENWQERLELEAKLRAMGRPSDA